MYRAVFDGDRGVWVTGIDLAEARRAVTANHPDLEVDLHDVTELAELAGGWDEVGAATAPRPRSASWPGLTTAGAGSLSAGESPC